MPIFFTLSCSVHLGRIFLSPWQDGELSLAELCLKRTGGVVKVGQALSYSGEVGNGEDVGAEDG